ncbi:serine/threonine protein kinase [Actinomadura macra]|uniref:serine/threonine protein kinase n=1 Tax=Actinomadura macra TaxID=46164 RepID=UPI00082A1A2D|nr:serine/threonine-protein kinase [Actinomadura macra]
MPEWMALQPSDWETVGPYRLEGRLGAGGQGTVYVGSAVPESRVAIKLLHPHLVVDERARARFLSEVDIAKRVAPFCTAQVLDSGIMNEQPYIVSEFVDGPSLQRSVQGVGPRGGAALERLALNTATALAAIHQAGVVHRDFKPGNVLLGPDGPVVIDFGLARALDASQSIITSQAVGSPGYMAPEQIAGDEVGPAADLFAWGATMVFAATGKRAFYGESIPAVMQSILHADPNLDALDGRLGGIVRACLAKDPARRPTAAEVGDRLRVLTGPAWRIETPAVAGNDGREGLTEHATERPSEQPSEQPGQPGRPSGQPTEHSIEDQTEHGGWRSPLEDDGWESPTEVAGRRRRPVRAGAVAVVLLAFLGLGSAVLFTDRGSEVSSDLAGPSPGRTSVPTGRPGTPSAKARSPVRSPAVPPTGAGRDPRKREGTDSSASPKPTIPTSSEKPRSSSPRVLGKVSSDDVHRYCRAKGYSDSGGGDGNYWCYGPGGMQVSLASVCRWAYPGHRNVMADGHTCKTS